MLMRREAFLVTVQERGQYATTAEADRVARFVLALLSPRLA
ncbi:hypothetical protein [Streptomyces sp. NPDC002580]